MSDKYIIRNCPACYSYGNKYGCEDNHDKQGRDTYCELINNCVMKQIVELAKGHTELCKNCEQQIKECDCNDICNAYRLNKILQLLDIKEVKK